MFIVHVQSLFYYPYLPKHERFQNIMSCWILFANCLLEGWTLIETPAQRNVSFHLLLWTIKANAIPASLSQSSHIQNPTGSHFIVHVSTRQIMQQTFERVFGIQVGLRAGKREKSTSLQTDEVIEMQGRLKRINLSRPEKESWSLCFHFWYLNWQSTSEADIYWSCSLKTILVKFRAHTGKRLTFNATQKFLKLPLITEKMRNKFNLQTWHVYGKHTATFTARRCLDFAITWCFLAFQITVLRCRVDVVPVNVTGLNHAILNQAEIPAALPIEELQT